MYLHFLSEVCLALVRIFLKRDFTIFLSSWKCPRILWNWSLKVGMLLMFTACHSYQGHIPTLFWWHNSFQKPTGEETLIACFVFKSHFHGMKFI
jgi:hypothetical protein